jgi:hypothetical protein
LVFLLISMVVLEVATTVFNDRNMLPSSPASSM